MGSDPLPNFSALGLTWDTKSDVLRIHCRNFVDASTQREMSSQSVRSFESRFSVLVGGKLILQKTSSLGILWDEKLPVSISERRKMAFVFRLSL